MKTIKTALLPIAILLVGVGSAFASSMSKDSKQTLKPGYVIRTGQPVECQDAEIMCHDNGTVICTVDLGWGIETVYDKIGASCVNELYFN